MTSLLVLVYTYQMFRVLKMHRNLASFLPLFLMVIFGYPNSAISDYVEFEGSLNCTVKHNEIATISEGKPKIYNGVKDEFDVGDDLIFTYLYQSVINRDRSLLYELKDVNRDRFLFSGYVADRDGGHLDINDFGSLRGWKVTETLGEPYLEKITLNDDRFYLENSFGRLTFNRYYKGDYEGIVVTNALVGALNSHTVLLDCRTIKDVVDDILKDFE